MAEPCRISSVFWQEIWGQRGLFSGRQVLAIQPISPDCSQFYLEQKSAKVLVTITFCWQNSFPVCAKILASLLSDKILAVNLKVCIANHHLFLSSFSSAFYIFFRVYWCVVNNWLILYLGRTRRGWGYDFLYLLVVTTK